MNNKTRKMRIRIVQEPKLALRRVILLTSSTVVVLSLCLIVFINFSNSRSALAALPSTGDFRSSGSGNWDNVATWQKYSGNTWVQADRIPSVSDQVIRILKGHTVTVTSNTSADQVLVSKGGFLIINSGVTLTINDGKGYDLEITGVVKNAGIISCTDGSVIVDEGGRYQHNYSATPGTIPNAVWMEGSTCEVTGYTTNTNAPAGLQTFSNFVWNCPAQQNDINLNAGITTLNGNLIVESTGSKSLNWANGPVTTNVSGNVIQTGGEFIFNKSSAITTLNIDGDFIQSGGNFSLSDIANAKSVLNIKGDYRLTGGISDFERGNGGTCTINLSGNMAHTGGTISVSGEGSSEAKFIFNNSGTQNYNSFYCTVTGNIDYVVNKGSVLDIGSSIMIGRNFTLSPEAGLIIRSPQGICKDGPAGSVQVSGIRSFSNSADYTYQGNSLQYTGNGLPATIRNLIVNNSGNLTLTNSVSVYGTLTFLNGNIITGDKEINIVNPSTASIAGYSTSNYVIGDIRRSVNGSGSYDFPIGSANNYELINVNLTGTSGVSNIMAGFNNRDAGFLSAPVANNAVDGIPVRNILSYGYWSLTPNAEMTGGSFSILATERGQENPVSGSTYALLSRSEKSAGWEVKGIQDMNLQPLNGSTVTTGCSGLKSFGDFAIGYGEFLRFGESVLIDGKHGKKNSTYKFKNVCSNVDAWVEVDDISGDASLVNIDDEASGYAEGWQPMIKIPAGKNASIQWQIKFKKANTSTDTILPGIALTALNINGSPMIKQFVKALNPQNYSVSQPSSLVVSNSDGWYKASSDFSSANNTDSSQKELMFQVKYKNINSFRYETGMTNNSDKPVLMQPLIYFKSFFNGNHSLPAKIVSFNAKRNDNKVELEWSTGTEVNNNYFTIERSIDGRKFEPVEKIKGAGNSSIKLYYKSVSPNLNNEYSYYRLKQTSSGGQSSYSEVAKLESNDSKSYFPNQLANK